MEEERDVVTFSDDEGNEFELEVIDYFDFEEQEYAVLVDPATADAEAEETEVYIMKVAVNGEYEEFLPADEDKMDQLEKIVEQRFEEMDEACEDGCECECDDHDCGCGDHGCGCGCDK